MKHDNSESFYNGSDIQHEWDDAEEPVAIPMDNFHSDKIDVGVSEKLASANATASSGKTFKMSKRQKSSSHMLRENSSEREKRAMRGSSFKFAKNSSSSRFNPNSVKLVN